MDQHMAKHGAPTANQKKAESQKNACQTAAALLDTPELLRQKHSYTPVASRQASSVLSAGFHGVVVDLVQVGRVLLVFPQMLKLLGISSGRNMKAHGNTVERPLGPLGEGFQQDRDVVQVLAVADVDRVRGLASNLVLPIGAAQRHL